MKNGLVASVMLVLSAVFLALPLHAQNATGKQNLRLLAVAPQTVNTQQTMSQRKILPPTVMATDPVIYDNGVIAPNTALASQLDTFFDAQVADDFTLPTGDGSVYGVTGVSFRGLYFDGPPAGPGTTDFNVIFYADNGSGTAPVGGPADPTGLAIAVRTVLTVVGVNVGVETWDWTLDFATPVSLSPDTKYWIAIQWFGAWRPQWGWSGDDTAGNSVSGFPLLGTNYWTPVSPAAEMDFQIHGDQSLPSCSGVDVTIANTVHTEIGLLCEATNSITVSNVQVRSPGSVTYRSGQSMSFTEFTVEIGATFTAIMD